MLEYTGEYLYSLLSAARDCLTSWDPYDEWLWCSVDGYPDDVCHARVMRVLEERIVAPILTALDWAVADRHEVTRLVSKGGVVRGYNVSSFGQTHFYLALFYPGLLGNERLLDTAWDGKFRDLWKRTCDWGRRRGIPWCVATDGDVWLLSDLSAVGEVASPPFVQTRLTECQTLRDFLQVVGVLSRDSAAAALDSAKAADIQEWMDPRSLDELLDEHPFDVRVRSALYALMERGDGHLLALIAETVPSLQDDEVAVTASLKLIRFDLARGAHDAARRRLAMLNKNNVYGRLVEEVLDRSLSRPENDESNRGPSAGGRGAEARREGPGITDDSGLGPPLPPEWGDDEDSTDGSMDAIGDEACEWGADDDPIEPWSDPLEDETDQAEADWLAKEEELEMFDVLADILDPEFEWQSFRDDDPADYAVEQRHRNWVDDFNLGDPYRGI